MTAAGSLNTDLDRISQWAATWLISFNPAQIESPLIFRTVNRPYHPYLFMQVYQITEVESHKHLGLYRSNDCFWHRHIDYITERLGIGLLY